MKTTAAILVSLACCMAFAPRARAESGPGNATPKEQQTARDERRIRIRPADQGGDVIVSLFDTPESRDFLSLLPLTVSFEDYARTEKIAYLPRKLAVAGQAAGAPARGDFAYFAPWGNLAVFYKGQAEQGGGLRILGRILSGKDSLAAIKDGCTAAIEVME